MKITVSESKNTEEFQALEKQVYANDPFHIPSPIHLPEQGTGFIAKNQGRVSACCIAALQTSNPSIGTIGHFNALNNPEAVQQMLSAAVQHLVSQNVKRIIAPMNGDTWHPYRFNKGPYTERPFIKEPWNPSYYPALIEHAGFIPAETYESHLVNDVKKAADNQVRFYRRCIRNNYSFSTIMTSNYEEMLPLIHKLSCRIFPDNVLYTPIDEDEFMRMYLPAKPLLQSGLSWLALDPDNEPAGYIFTFPDYSEAVQSMKGKTSLPAKIKFCLNKRKATRTCIKTLGVLPGKRGSGLTAALTYLSYKNSIELGYTQTLMCLMHSANDSRKFGGKANHSFRSYTLYEYAL